MAQFNRANGPYVFNGVHTAGHPARRPENTAAAMTNLRPLPGGMLRLIGGRRARYYEATAAATIMRLHEYREPTGNGFTSQMRQHNNGASPNVVKWQWFSLVSWAVSDILTISQTNDSGWTRTNPAAVENLFDKVMIYNGLGDRDGTNSKPPFSLWIPALGEAHYCGMDLYCPAGNAPTAGTSAGSGLTVATHIKVSVGLYNSRTGHYSNTVDCGTVAAGTYAGITVSNLNRIAINYNSLIEQGDIKFVFYFSIDGGENRYLHMATNGYDPYTEASTATATTAAQIPNIDLTKPTPTRNHPPRPMRWLAKVGGRLYGAPMPGGSGGVGGAVDGFNYTFETKRYSGVVYSNSGATIEEGEELGDPLQSWPPDQFFYTPNFEQPIAGLPSPDGYRLLALCQSSCFLFEEASDGVHEPTTVSLVHGIAVQASAVVAERETEDGREPLIIWTDQNNVICALVGGSEKVQVLSRDYQTLLTGKTPRAATYTLDPANFIDRYELYCTDGTCVIHDFNTGLGYTVNSDVTAARSMRSAVGSLYHMVAKRHMYSQAGQPNNNREIVANEDYDGSGNVVESAITGVVDTQWMDEGDGGLRKQMPHVLVEGDGTRLTVDVYRDYQQQVTDNKISTTNTALTQTNSLGQRVTDWIRAFILGSNFNAYLFKARITLAGPIDSNEYHNTMDEYGNAAASTNWLGVICGYFTRANGNNR